jgi:hypothetical protein
MLAAAAVAAGEGKIDGVGVSAEEAHCTQRRAAPVAEVEAVATFGLMHQSHTDLEFDPYPRNQAKDWETYSASGPAGWVSAAWVSLGTEMEHFVAVAQ